MPDRIAMHDMSPAAAIAQARAALADFDAREAEAIRRWAVFGEGATPRIKHATRASLARAVAEAEGVEYRATGLPA